MLGVVFLLATLPLEEELVVSEVRGAALPIDIEQHPEKETIGRWVQNGWIELGDDRRFRPDEPIDRATFSQWVNWVYRFGRERNLIFTDVSSKAVYREDISKVVAAGVLEGYDDGTFKPDQTLTRQEAAVVFSRLARLPDDVTEADGLTDRATIAKWSVGAVGAVLKTKLMQPLESYRFMPEVPIKRSDVLLALHRLLPEYIHTKLYARPGVFGPSSGQLRIDHDVRVDTEGITLQNMYIEGKLTLRSMQGQQLVTLNNVTVGGEVVVHGSQSGGYVLQINQGDMRRIRLMNTPGKSVSIRAFAQRPVPLVIDSEAEVQTAVFSGQFSSVEVNSPGNEVTFLTDTSVERIAIAQGAEKNRIYLETGSVVKELLLDAPAIIHHQGQLLSRLLGTYGEQSLVTTTVPPQRESMLRPWEQQTSQVNTVFSPTRVTGVIEGLSAPVTGAVAPQTWSTKAYTGRVTWRYVEDGTQKILDENKLFAPGVTYTAEATLTAQEGYTFAGVPANALTHVATPKTTHPAGEGEKLQVQIEFRPTELIEKVAEANQ